MGEDCIALAMCSSIALEPLGISVMGPYVLKITPLDDNVICVVLIVVIFNHSPTPGPQISLADSHLNSFLNVVGSMHLHLCCIQNLPYGVIHKKCMLPILGYA